MISKKFNLNLVNFRNSGKIIKTTCPVIIGPVLLELVMSRLGMNDKLLWMRGAEISCSFVRAENRWNWNWIRTQVVAYQCCQVSEDLKFNKYIFKYQLNYRCAHLRSMNNVLFSNTSVCQKLGTDSLLVPRFQKLEERSSTYSCTACANAATNTTFIV